MFNFRLIAYLSAAAIAAVVLAYGIGRYQGAAAERRACEAEIHAAELTAERQARETERRAQEAQNAIVQDYERQVADYKRTIDSYIDADRLSGTSTCPKLPKASGAQPGLSATPNQTFHERLQRVWLSQPSATKSQSDIKH